MATFLKYAWSIWKGLGGWAKAGSIVALLVVFGIATGGGEKSESAADASASEPSMTAPGERDTEPIREEKQTPDAEVEVVNSDTDLKKPKAHLKLSTVPANASVSISRTYGGAVLWKGEAKGGKASKWLNLKVGSNDYDIEVSAPGYRTANTSVNFTRKRSQAELAALREKRAAARAAREAAFKANAVTISYKQLQKSADSYSDKKVKYYGQIMQIQEDPLGGGMMLLSVTDEGYGFWTDEIWVNYDGKVHGAEDDMLTVYGTVQGSKSFETQIGGERYVPEIDARYIDE